MSEKANPNQSLAYALILGFLLGLLYLGIEGLFVPLSLLFNGEFDIRIIGVMISPIACFSMAGICFCKLKSLHHSRFEPQKFFGYGLILLAIYTAHYSVPNLFTNIYWMENWPSEIPIEHKPTWIGQINIISKSALSILYFAIGLYIILSHGDRCNNGAENASN